MSEAMLAHLFLRSALPLRMTDLKDLTEGEKLAQH